ncbi:MAG TPA: DEAD/DEAH box helicase [Candidatus Omnitrophota bacterium]|nr:DEAD/DEAH box helicase [Candidatus Omnitrophota bacterium]HPS19366.1 DEAD/DEAH box helicase [Candidatus Omnitrophota bacterium]
MQGHESQGFYAYGIAPAILEKLAKMKITKPTPIQAKAIPEGIQGKDIIGVAETGTGKTLAFAIPILQKLAQNKQHKALILVPTRELAAQVDETFRKVVHLPDIKIAIVIGGASMGDQIRALKSNARVIIATPGRLIDHLDRRTVNLASVGIIVLDEADRMLDMGFKPQIEEVLKFVPKERQTMLFSATIPQEIMSLASRYMKLPISIEISPSGTIASKVSQELFIVKSEEKRKLLSKMLEQYPGAVLIFSRTKRGAGKIKRMIADMGHSAAEIHSDRTQGQRKQALDGFRSGRFRILVATDIAARGIDVTGIELVVNYDLPEDAENYVHRIGRTGRAGHEGHAVSFATPDQGDEVRKIEKTIRTNLPVSEHPEIPGSKFDQAIASKPAKFWQFKKRPGQSSRPTSFHSKKPGFRRH